MSEQQRSSPGTEHLQDLVRNLRARRIMCDGGNGNVYDIADEDCERAANFIELTILRGAARGSQEPVCWIVLAKETDNVRIWWRRKEMAEEWAKTHDAPLIPLYAHPCCADAVLPLSASPPSPVAVDRYAVDDPWCRPVGKTWTPDQFWEYVGGLAGEFEAGQIRDMLASKGLSLSSTEGQ